MPQNNTPIYNPEGRFTIWRLDEIYTGPSGLGRFVPLIGDLVCQIVGNIVTFYTVTDLNIGTYVATLVETTPVGAASLTPYEIAMGVGPNSASQTMRIYIDKRTIPYSLCVDSRVHVYGMEASVCKIFAGTDLSANGRVISAVYDNGGSYVGENVGLELVANDAYSNNVAIKVAQACKTSANLIDGEVVTAVYYSAAGNVVDKRQLLVVNTAFIRSSNANAKTVVGVGLRSPFLSSIHAKTLIYPRNVSLSPDNLVGLVHYSDGTELALPVDGVRFSVAGLEAFNANSVGVSYPLVLLYALSNNEQAYGDVGGVRTKTDTYTLTTAEANLDYQVRLFPYPKWINSTVGYRLTWWLLDAARSLAQDVSNLVEMAPDSAVFGPKIYGLKQTLKARINLSLVVGNYDAYIHVQEIDVNLQAPGTYRQNLSTPPNWYVSAIAGQTPLFGAGVFAKFTLVSGNTKTFDIKGGFTTLESWLDAFYWNSQPIVRTPVETAAPAPTHFTLVINGFEFQYPLAAWNTILTLDVTAASNDTIYIRFQFAGQTMLELGCAGMPLYQLNSNGSYA